MIYTIENDLIRVSVESFGAELYSIKDIKTDDEYLWQGDPEIWYGRSPILFPIIGRLLNDRYRLNGIEYTMPKHGLFRKRPAELVYQDDSSMTFRQVSDDDTLQCYPYTFEVYVTFQVIDNALYVTHKVVNTNESTMYFSIGAHPAFQCRIGDRLVFSSAETLFTETIDNDSIRLPEKSLVLDNEDTIVITDHLFDHDALILSGIRSKTVQLVKADNRNVIFDFGGCPYLGIWAKPGAPYVCLEPWWGVNDDRNEKNDLSEKEGIQVLQPNEEFSMDWSASFPAIQIT